ncbi:MAG: DUF362 domain-containing protein [Candidatus Pacebacteria bacterium]|nr:DUF362 domain-containing protein [Candidatus Paceibacterota bacterium]
MSKVYISKIKKDLSIKDKEEAVRKVLLESTQNLKWLTNGQTVLLKPALNSPDPYPATTSPVSVRVVTQVLEERGAKVIIGDQSGIGHVVHDSRGVGKGNSQDNFVKSGMAGEYKDRFIAFEQRGWEEGFFHYQSDKLKHWDDGFFVTNTIKEVDHIIGLPRVSTHSQAGVTLGYKNWVGILREDSRMEFHADGPFGTAMMALARNLKLDKKFQNQGAFWEKIIEISHVIEDKHRINLFYADKVQATMGPDAHRSTGMKAKVVEPEEGIVFASTNQLAAEYVAIEFLTQLYKGVGMADKLKQKALVRMNGQMKELGTYDIWDNNFLKAALKLGMGDKEVEKVYL